MSLYLQDNYLQDNICTVRVLCLGSASVPESCRVGLEEGHKRKKSNKNAIFWGKVLIDYPKDYICVIYSHMWVCCHIYNYKTITFSPY